MSSKFSENFISKIKNAHTVGALTGAGVSAESGVPTFRDKNGLWQKYRPEDLANFDSFIKNPDFVWNWYQHRREIMNTVKPNQGHFALAEMETIFPVFNLITQNIDNLHSRAGSKNITELHGNIERNFCIKCRKFYDKISVNEKQVLKCDCGGLIRPDVVWFGEMLPQNELQKAQEIAMNCQVFLTIGTSAEVYPAAMLPIIAKRSGAYVVEINLNETSISVDCHETYQGKSGTILNDLVKILKLNKI